MLAARPSTVSAADSDCSVQGPPPAGCPIRVCYVIGSLDVGGAEVQLVRLASHLDRERFAPSICCLSHAGEMYEDVRALGIPVHVISDEEAWWWWTHSVRALERVFVSERPDVAHGLIFPTYSLVAIAAARVRGPIVVAGVRSLGLGLELQWPYRWLERAGNRMTHRIVSNSQAVKEALLRRDASVGEKTSVIYNGIDVERYRLSDDQGVIRKELGLDRAELIILMVANLIAYKGHREVLEMLAEFRRRRSEGRLLVVGTGPCEAALRRQAEDLGIASHVSFLGRRNDIPRLLCAADVVLLASHQEGFPNAILEAMAAAKPVIATRVGGVPEQVEPGVTGYLVEPGNVTGMADALERIAADPERGSRMGKEARRRAAERFSWSVIAPQYESLYTSVLAKTGEAVRLAETRSQ